MKHKNETSRRIFEFVVRVIKFLEKIPNTIANNIIRYQLIKSASSVGANYEESQSGISKADFLNKVRISLKESNESNYWLRIIKHTNKLDIKLSEELNYLIKESYELSLILGKIVNGDRNKKQS